MLAKPHYHGHHASSIKRRCAEQASPPRTAYMTLASSNLSPSSSVVCFTCAAATTCGVGAGLRGGSAPVATDFADSAPAVPGVPPPPSAAGAEGSGGGFRGHFQSMTSAFGSSPASAGSKRDSTASSSAPPLAAAPLGALRGKSDL
jgi:hypothetical protein